MRSIITGLTPASGRQDHTTSPSAMSGVRLSPLSRPPHPTATFVTCATPLLPGETGRVGSGDLPDDGSGILPVGLFCRSRCDALMRSPGTNRRLVRYPDAVPYEDGQQRDRD